MTEGEMLGWHHQHDGHEFEQAPRDGNGYPLQYSYQDNPMDTGAWWAIVYGVAKSQTQLK